MDNKTLSFANIWLAAITISIAIGITFISLKLNLFDSLSLINKPVDSILIISLFLITVYFFFMYLATASKELDYLTICFKQNLVEAKIRYFIICFIIAILVSLLVANVFDILKYSIIFVFYALFDMLGQYYIRSNIKRLVSEAQDDQDLVNRNRITAIYNYYISKPHFFRSYLIMIIEWFVVLFSIKNIFYSGLFYKYSAYILQLLLLICSEVTIVTWRHEFYSQFNITNKAKKTLKLTSDN